jgi:hypothetical protein
MLCSWLSRSLPHTMCKGKASGLKSEKIQVPTTCKVPSNPISAFIVYFFYARIVALCSISLL